MEFLAYKNSLGNSGANTSSQSPPQAVFPAHTQHASQDSASFDWTPACAAPLHQPFRNPVPFSGEEAIDLFEINDSAFNYPIVDFDSDHIPQTFDNAIQDSSAPKTEGSTSPEDGLKKNVSSAPLVCPWNGCKRQAPFSTKGTLGRHVQTQHMAPRSFKCPQPQCNRSFSRKDNLNQHRRAVHQDIIQKGASSSP